MIGRVGLVMATYLVVGMLLAVGADPPTPVDRVGEAGARAPVPVLATADRPKTIVSPTTESTVSWASGRLAASTDSSAVPVTIEIPSIGVVAEVVASGIDTVSRQMAIPAEADLVGWYRYGPEPGDAGSAVFAGHVDMAGYGPGAFFELDRLVTGDLVSIHMSDGSSVNFEVVETVRVPKGELDLDEVFDNAGPARVTLVTCGGAFNQTERSYVDNVVSSLRPAGANA